MKKLIVIMCAAVFGLATQAASVAWSFSWATDASGNDLSSGTAYLMNVATMTTEAADAALTAKTFDTSKALATSAVTFNDSDGGHGGGVDTVDLTGSQTFYAVIVSGDNYGITQTVPVTMKALGDTMVAFAELSDDSGVSSMTWKPGGVAGGSSGDIPEPTSGLLLLVGGAMLALRRKQR